MAKSVSQAPLGQEFTRENHWLWGWTFASLSTDTALPVKGEAALAHLFALTLVLLNFHLQDQLSYHHPFPRTLSMARGENFPHGCGLRGDPCTAKGISGSELLCWVITTCLRCYKLNCKEQMLGLAEGREPGHQTRLALDWMCQPGTPGASRATSKLSLSQSRQQSWWVKADGSPLHCQNHSRAPACSIQPSSPVQPAQHGESFAFRKDYMTN